jgi:hypothetical protein
MKFCHKTNILGGPFFRDEIHAVVNIIMYQLYGYLDGKDFAAELT